ncbi:MULTISPECIES: hypothetical protein [Lysinibacillus]|uniref:hypothetical protein n=1 Tax=Lysinibacillus TaxID=400634 RepID=UPI000BBB09B0|nr:hypothetical protein [Lysinibacillus fusiformis]PCD81617.1 hypothetical protein CNQ87_13260 [Lysinibacillus fusiformis]
MGSVGTGAFGTFGDAKRYDKERCLRELPEIELQEVAHSEYYTAEGEVPNIFTAVYVAEKTKNGRLQVLLADDEREIGLLPSDFNYLLTCLSKGHRYSGTIVYSEDSHFPKIVVNLDAK